MGSDKSRSTRSVKFRAVTYAHITQSGKHRKKYKFILCYLSSSAPVTLVTLKTPKTPEVQDPVPRPVAVWGLRKRKHEKQTFLPPQSPQ